MQSLTLLLTLAGLLVAAPAGAQEGPPPASAPFRTYLPMMETLSAGSSMEQQVVDLTNQLREQSHCPPLRLSPQLLMAARGHSQDMADHNYFSHIDLQGHDSAWRAAQAGYIGTAGWENIAAGYATPSDVVNAWMSSDGHRRNMLDCSLTDIGVGYGYRSGSTYGSYWTQAFGVP